MFKFFCMIGPLTYGSRSWRIILAKDQEMASEMVTPGEQANLLSFHDETEQLIKDHNSPCVFLERLIGIPQSAGELLDMITDGLYDPKGGPNAISALRLRDAILNIRSTKFWL